MSELDDALRRLERTLRRLRVRARKRSIAKSIVRYALSPGEAIADGIEAVVDLALDD
jgi:hypothetical protein